MRKAFKVMLLLVLATGLLTIGCSTQAKPPEIGKTVPSFQLKDINGESVSLSDFQGVPVLLNFWATWCGPCHMEVPYIQEVHNRWSEQRVVILAINVGESPSRVSKFIQAYNITFRVLLDTEVKVAEKYYVPAYPTTYFIDSDGVLRAVQIGAFRSVAEIEDMLSSVFP